MWGSTDNLVCAFQALVWAYSEGESGASALTTSAAGGELFPGVPVQHTGLAAGREQNAAQARRRRRHRPLLPAAGCQSILLLIQVRIIFLYFYLLFSVTGRTKIFEFKWWCWCILLFVFSITTALLVTSFFSLSFEMFEYSVLYSVFSLVFAHLRPPEIDNQMVNKTVKACCEGWVGPRCSESEFLPSFYKQFSPVFSVQQKWYLFLFFLFLYLLFLCRIFLPFALCLPGVGARGHCFSTWSCQEFPGVHNSSLMTTEQCCSSLWGLSWRNASDQSCLSCTYTLLPGPSACMPTCTQTQTHTVLLIIALNY